jgi:MFS family permease
MLQGFGASGAIAMSAGSIADIFFLHERGLYNGIWIAISQSGPFISLMILGAVIEDLGWRWSLWVMAIFAGASLFLISCFLPETS